MSLEATAPRPGQVWLGAIRPQTLSAGLAPVIVGSALAAADDAFAPLAAMAALIGALLIQVGTNLFNDWADFVRGADSEDRLGPPRGRAGRRRPRGPAPR